MGYVRTAEEVEAYDLFYRGVVSNAHAVGASFTTTREFARSVLPPCFDVPENPTGSIYVCTNCEEIGGERTEEDEEAGVVTLDVLYKGQQGSYSLSVFVNKDQSLATGREAWSMPKKLGEIHLMGNGRNGCVIAQRKGAEMRLEVLLNTPEFTITPIPTKSIFYEIKAPVKASGGFQVAPMLIEFEVTQHVYMSQEGVLENTRLSLKGTDDDPLHTVPVGKIISAYAVGYKIETNVRREIDLGSEVDYRPYIYGRFYDDWPRTAAKAAKARSSRP